LLSLWAAAPVSAQAIPAAQRQAVAKGLQWLASQQQKDGRWQTQGNYPVSMTALAGMALLLEGSTPHTGKYRQNLQRAVTWLLDRCGPDGLIGSPPPPGEEYRYLWGHGYGLLFLACVYEREKAQPPPAEEVDARLQKRRLKRLETALKRAVAFSAATRTTRGGWGYVAAAAGSDFDEPAPTAVQVQALLAARHAGIPVPEPVLAGGLRYLKAAISHSRASDGKFRREQPPVLFAAIAVALQAGQGNAAHVKEWVRQMPQVTTRRDFAAYRHCYEAQALHLLGDKGRAMLLKQLLESQAPDGTWPGSSVGALYDTAAHLTALQLGNGTIPFYRRER
jgi:hypothetical protein